MRYLGYTLGDPSAPIAPPTQEDFAKMGEFIEEATKAGVFLTGGGVAPLDEAVKIQYHDGEFTVLDGPFTEAKELVGGWALLECRDMAEAIEWTKRFLTVAGRVRARSGRSTDPPAAMTTGTGWRRSPQHRAARHPVRLPGSRRDGVIVA